MLDNLAAAVPEDPETSATMPDCLKITSSGDWQLPFVHCHIKNTHRLVGTGPHTELQLDGCLRMTLLGSPMYRREREARYVSEWVLHKPNQSNYLTPHFNCDLYVEEFQLYIYKPQIWIFNFLLDRKNGLFTGRKPHTIFEITPFFFFFSDSSS